MRNCSKVSQPKARLMQAQQKTPHESAQTLAESGALSLVPEARVEHLPVPVQRNGKKRRTWRIAAALLVIVIGAGGAGYYVWKKAHPPLPIGISFGNGRIEADEIDIDTKFAGRVSELLADIGD